MGIVRRVGWCGHTGPMWEMFKKTCVELFPKVQSNFLERKGHMPSSMPAFEFWGSNRPGYISPPVQVVGVTEQRGRFIMTQCCIQKSATCEPTTAGTTGSTSRYVMKRCGRGEEAKTEHHSSAASLFVFAVTYILMEDAREM